jgi:hypothetical protein
MSNKNQIIQENIEDDMENEFLTLSEKIIDKLKPKKELSTFEIDINEIMKSGCNRQIAEYVLMKYNIQEKLKEENQKYIASKKEIINDIINKLGTKLDNLLKDENRKDDVVEYEPLYEEIYDEIVEYLLNKNPKSIIDINFIKNGVVKLLSTENINFDKFKNEKEIYVKKREPIIEAALRLVKKIVNNKKQKPDEPEEPEESKELEDSEEYKKFLEEYFEKEKIEPFI